MKTIRYILSSLIVLTMFACTDDLISNKDNDIQVTAGILQTRTSFSEDGNVTHVTWNVNDEIGLYSPTQSNLKYTAAKDGSSTELVASGTKISVDDGETVFAYYPYSTSATNGTISNSNQSSTNAATAYDYMYAVGKVAGGTVNLQFQHVFAFLKVSISVSKLNGNNLVVYKGSSQSILGKDITIGSDKITPVEGNSYFDIPDYDDLTSKGEQTFYIAVLPQDGNVELNFGSYSDGVYKKSFSKTTPSGGLVAGNVYKVSFDKEIELADTGTGDPQRDALIALYEATDGANWTNNTNWCTDKDISEWYGVYVNSSKNVFALSLAKNNLVGSIPASIGNLTKLRYLYLYDNKLSGTIPSEIGNLTEMQYLYLYNNQLSGSIPSEIGQLTNVEDLWLCDNQLSGELPSSLSNVMGASRLYLYSNNLSGIIPESVSSHSTWADKWAYFIYDNNFDVDNSYLAGQKFSVTDINGNTVTSDMYAKNKLTMIFFIYTQSSYTQNYISTVVSLYKRYKEKGLEIVSFTPEGSSYKSAIQQFMSDYGVTWPVVYADSDANKIPHIGIYPAFYLVDENGKVVLQDYNGHSRSELPTFLASYLGASDVYTSTDYSKDGEVFKIQSASVGNGIDLVFLGDGFTDKDMESGGVYEQKMKEAAEKYFTYEPMKSFRNRFNIYGVKVVSANDDWAEGVMNHKISEDTQIAYNYAMKIPNSDKNRYFVTVVYNADWSVGRSYTGFDSSGSYIGFVMEPSADVLTHEVCGHGLGNLFDEYVESGYEKYSPTDEGKEAYDYQYKYYGWGANVDWRSDLSTIRWTKFINDSRYAYEGLGAYEGAATLGKGMYRPTENSMMRYNDTPFNAPSREQIYKRIMKYSEGDSWTYDYETFVTYDAINRSSVMRSLTQKPSQSAIEHHRRYHRPPIMIEGTWEKSKVQQSNRYFGPLR